MADVLILYSYSETFLRLKLNRYWNIEIVFAKDDFYQILSQIL